MVALSANRLVCSAMELMTLITSPISALLWPKRVILSFVSAAASTAFLATSTALDALPAISLMLTSNSLTAVESVRALALTSSAAQLAMLARSVVSDAFKLSSLLTFLRSFLEYFASLSEASFSGAIVCLIT